MSDHERIAALEEEVEYLRDLASRMMGEGPYQAWRDAVGLGLDLERG